MKIHIHEIKLLTEKSFVDDLCEK